MMMNDNRIDSFTMKMMLAMNRSQMKIINQKKNNEEKILMTIIIT
ncbi:hypothetical protein BLA29_010845 [Euroglyphus maynei]|uniref:Uncharacterized protein n=1 Tax=Euroglyphus maynei TaxID=6958 RepID=A0A1Y3AQZ3_EURMA|nr:hypothetical protein BLA29_010845 [Euroglyphus maynei]